MSQKSSVLQSAEFVSKVLMADNIDRRLPERRHVWPGSAIKGVGQTFAEAGDRRRANADGLGARSDEWTVPKFVESGNLSLNYAVTR